METFAPTQLIQDLDLNEIDASIDRYEREIKALKQLRKVVELRDGTASGNSRGRSRSSTGSAEAVTPEILESVWRHLEANATRLGVGIRKLRAECCPNVAENDLRAALASDERFRRLATGAWKLRGSAT